ncbi:hypothetical protein N7468_008102, partial [Penicillium chermesinum]
MSGSFFAAPNQQRHLRACMVCSIVQTHTVKIHPRRLSQLRDHSPAPGNNDAIQECTSQVFEGLISIRDPSASWVARWQRLDNYVPGTYATKVSGSLSEDIIGSLEDSGVKYVPRDGSTGEEE